MRPALPDWVPEPGNDAFWRFAPFYPGAPEPAFRLPCPWSAPPVVPLKHENSVDCLIWREDISPTGSHKVRSACFQMSRMLAERRAAAVVSSTGNAARALGYFSRRARCRLVAFMARDIAKGKLAAALETGIHVILSPKPVNHARYAARIFGLPNLRPSLDPAAATGFMSLGFDLALAFPEPPDAVFIFSTSGATLLGLQNAFLIINRKLELWARLPQVHAVQSGKAAYLAERFHPEAVRRDVNSPAGRGAVAGSRLAEPAAAFIRMTGGDAWYIPGDDIRRAADILNANGIRTSPEGAAALAAAKKWQNRHGGRPLVILTGAAYPVKDVEPFREQLHHAETYLDVRRRVEGILGNP